MKQIISGRLLWEIFVVISCTTFWKKFLMGKSVNSRHTGNFTRQFISVLFLQAVSLYQLCKHVVGTLVYA